MSKENQKLKYCIYARKSTEDEGRQVQSIEDQINNLTKKAKDWGLNVVAVFKESKSAKAPDIRTEFYKMVDKIKKGEIDAILCWKIDRLSRNGVDSGLLQHLLQNGVIKVIHTSEKEFYPYDSGLLFYVEAGMTNQYIQDLSKNVIRGQKSKAEKGWFPGVPPIGYLNTVTEGKGSNYIKTDPIRFPIIRKAFELMLSGQYTVPQILKIVNERLGLRTRKFKKKGGDKLSRSMIYKILSNPFYTGVFKWKGKEYQGKHEKMVTLEEFNKVQLMLGRKGNPRPSKHQFKFTGIAKCNCGSAITAEVKRRINRKTNQVREYIYYHCTRRKKGVNCTQSKVITESEFEKRFLEEISRIKILPDFRELAQKMILEYRSSVVEERQNTYRNLSNLVQETQKQIDALLDLRLKDLIDEDRFKEKNAKLEAEKKQLKERLNEVDDRTEWLNEQTRLAIDFVANAKISFEKGSIQKKKKVLIGLGSNFLWYDGKLSLELSPWFIPIETKYPEVEDIYNRFELYNTEDLATNSTKKEAFENVRLLWRGRRDSNSRPHA